VLQQTLQSRCGRKPTTARHNDEDERAEPIGWTQISERSSFSLEGKQCVCADLISVYEIVKLRTPNPFTRLASVEML
jgi:hypothetical protein